MQNVMTTEDEVKNLPATPDEEIDNIYHAAHTHVPLLRFRKGKYYVGSGDGEEVPLGTEYMVYALDWRRGWRKWKDDHIVEDRVVRVADNRAEPLERDELDDRDEANWEEGLDGEPKDPWVLVNELPMENIATGERLLFTTSSFGGKIAVEKVAAAYAQNVRKRLEKGLPVIALTAGVMKTKAYGPVPRPDFPITRWEFDTGMIDITPPADDERFNDSIPF
jgi:hypothetical protein